MTKPSRAALTAAALALTLVPLAGPARAGGEHPRAHHELSWELLDTPADTARLRGLAPVGARVVWASGSEGTVLRSTDAGRSWSSVGPPGTGSLQFRDIEASSAERAVVLSIGPGEESRVYVTDDGGHTWAESFRNTDPAAFYDCLTFTTPRVGYAMSDPVDGRFRVIRTRDGGHSWEVMDSTGMPPARDGEFAFAASGTCLQSDAAGNLHLATGGVDPARVFTSRDGGDTWTVADSPVAGGPSAGIYSLSFQGRRGVAVGGDYAAPEAAEGNAAWTADGGRTWHTPRGTGLGGYRSGSAWAGRSWPGRFGSHPSRAGGTVLAVGPTGSDVSRDGGRSWSAFDTGSFDSVECVASGPCYASGEKGRVAVLRAR
jgi:photosystem II stability/assembly factor-like uncharacterized protein